MRVVHVSINMNEVIRAVLNFLLFFFLQKNITHKKNRKRTKQLQANIKQKRLHFLCA